MSPLNKLKSFMTPSEPENGPGKDDAWLSEDSSADIDARIAQHTSRAKAEAASLAPISPTDLVKMLPDDNAPETASLVESDLDQMISNSSDTSSDISAASPLTDTDFDDLSLSETPSSAALTETLSMQSLFESDESPTSPLPTSEAMDTRAAEHLDVSAPRELAPTSKTNNLTHIRADLAQLNDDMSSGERFYAQSLKRINNLISYAYETEANLSALEKLEPENARLKDDLEKAKQRANDEVVRAESFKSKAEAYESRFVEARQSLETAQLSLTKLESERQTLERKLSDTEVEIAGLTNSNRTIRNELAIDRQTHETLSAKNLSLSSELSVALSEKLELEKRHMDVSTRLESLTAEKTELERMLAQTRSLHRATEEHNVSLKAEMEQVLNDVKVFKQQFDASTRNRDTELNSLRAKLSDLQTEIRIKEDVVEHGRQEMAELRAKHDAAHRGRKNLMSHIEDQKKKLEILQKNEQAAKDVAQDSNSKVITLQAEVDQLRRINSAQSEKLKKYMAITAMPVSAPVAAAAPALDISGQETASLKPTALEDASTSSTVDDAIERLPVAGAPIKEPLESRARRRAERLVREEQMAAPTTKSSNTETSKAASSSPDMAEFDRQFDDLEVAPAPSADSGTSASPPPFTNGTQHSEEALDRFHEIDLLG